MKQNKYKTKYKCGHSPVATIINNNILAALSWIVWKDSVGFDGTKEQCFDCYCLEERKAEGIAVAKDDKVSLPSLQKRKTAIYAVTILKDGFDDETTLYMDNKEAKKAYNKLKESKKYSTFKLDKPYFLYEDNPREGYISKDEVRKVIDKTIPIYEDKPLKKLKKRLKL